MGALHFGKKRDKPLNKERKPMNSSDLLMEPLELKSQTLNMKVTREMNSSAIRTRWGVCSQSAPAQKGWGPGERGR